jgi:hypothetical protein
MNLFNDRPCCLITIEILFSCQPSCWYAEQRKIKIIIYTRESLFCILKTLCKPTILHKYLIIIPERQKSVKLKKAAVASEAACFKTKYGV